MRGWSCEAARDVGATEGELDGLDDGDASMRAEIRGRGGSDYWPRADVAVPTQEKAELGGGRQQNLLDPGRVYLQSCR